MSETANECADLRGIPAEKVTDFAVGVRDLVNRLSIDNALNTPDYVLSCYLRECLMAFAGARRGIERHENGVGSTKNI